MAGEWIKMRLDLATDPGVNRIRRATGIDADAIVGKLHRLWSWADVHTTDGIANGVDAQWIDEFAGVSGFSDGMIAAGWLECDSEKVQFANFDKHNGASAKRRCAQKTRVENSRAQTVTLSAHTLRTECAPEKRREEKSNTNTHAAHVATSVLPKRQKRIAAPSRISWSVSLGWEGIEAEDRSSWESAFPGAKIDTELAKATVWLVANPTKAGKRNWASFLARWLSKCQDGGGTDRGTTNGRQQFREPDKPCRPWTGSDDDRFAATRKKLAEDLVMRGKET